jgi:hypothetical protein
VGFNPYQKFQAKPSDYVLVASAVLVTVALLIWAIAG